jgi:HTH-type transcriptional regulator / antitoxin HigA
METKIIKTEQDYNEACERVYSLINSSEILIEPESKEGEELELLSFLIEKYEEEHYQLKTPTPIEAIKFRMDQMNLIQSDIAFLFGGKTRISEILNGKRQLNLKTISLLNKYLGIPLESLISNYKDLKLKPEQKKRLLKIESVKKYLSGVRASLL